MGVKPRRHGLKPAAGTAISPVFARSSQNGASPARVGHARRGRICPRERRPTPRRSPRRAGPCRPERVKPRRYGLKPAAGTATSPVFARSSQNGASPARVVHARTLSRRSRARSAHGGEAPPGELREPRAGLMAFLAPGFNPGDGGESRIHRCFGAITHSSASHASAGRAGSGARRGRCRAADTPATPTAATAPRPDSPAASPASAPARRRRR